MNIQEKVNKYISEGKTKAEAINMAYDEKPKQFLQQGGTVDMYGNPINAPIQHKDIPRSFYDSRRGVINVGTDFDKLSPQEQDELIAHENRHDWQYKNGRSNFEITHNPEFAFNERLQKKPSIVNTDEVFNNYNNRQQKETDLELANIKKQNPQFSFMPNQILYDKGFSDGLYDNKFALEGEAQYYQKTGQKSFQEGGGIPKKQKGGTWENQILKKIQKRNEQIYLEAQNYPRNKPLDINSEEYKKAYDDYNVFNYDKNTDTYIGRELEEVVIPQKKGFWEQSRDKYLEEHKDDGVLGAIGSVVTYPLAVGQDAMMYGLTGKVQTPTEGLGIRKGMEGVAGSVFNMAADPANLIGAGILTKESLLEKIAMSKESGLLSNAYKLNPNAFKPNSNSFYRQIDNTTYNEGLESGLIRGKQDIDMTSGEGTINLNKAFGDDAYYNKGSLYYKNNEGLPYLFEAKLGEDKFIPKVNGRTRKYTTENTSVRVSKEPLFINDPNITAYKKDWLQGYKQVEVPREQQGGTINYTKDELAFLKELKSRPF